MASVFLRHHVSDFAAWKQAFDELEPRRREYGFHAHSIHRDVGRPGAIIVALRANNLHRAREMMQSDGMRTTMELAGVEGEPDVWLAEDIEDKSYQDG